MAENELQEVINNLEKKEIEVAFLQEEKEDAEKLASERWTRQEQLNEKLMKLEAQRDDFQVRKQMAVIVGLNINSP